jgi:hypothetical protein
LLRDEALKVGAKQADVAADADTREPPKANGVVDPSRLDRE